MRIESKLAIGGRFRVFEDGSVTKIYGTEERPATITATGKRGRYAIVTYMDGGKQKSAYVHRMVATAFLPNPDNLPQVNHIDGNPMNNAVENLEWVSASRNVQHAYDEGLSNPFATSKECTACGRLTNSKSGICPACRKKLSALAAPNNKRAEQADRYSEIDFSLLTEKEAKYVSRAAIGLSAREIAEEFGVTRQSIYDALDRASKAHYEKKRTSPIGLSKAQQNRWVALVIKANKERERFESAISELKKRGENLRSALDALEQFENQNP